MERSLENGHVEAEDQLSSLRAQIAHAEARQDEGMVVELEEKLRLAERAERARLREEQASAQMRTDSEQTRDAISDLRTQIASAEREEDGTKVARLVDALHDLEKGKDFFNDRLAVKSREILPEEPAEVFEATPTTIVNNADTRVEETPERPSVVTDLRNRINRAEAEEDDSKVVKLEGQLRGAEEDERLRAERERTLAQMKADRVWVEAEISTLRVKISRAEKEDKNDEVIRLEKDLHRAEEDLVFLDKRLAEVEATERKVSDQGPEVTSGGREKVRVYDYDVEEEVEAAEAKLVGIREEISRAEKKDDGDKVLKLESELRQVEKRLAYEKARLGKYNELSDLESEIREQKEKVKAVENSNEEAYTEELAELRRLEEHRAVLLDAIENDWSLDYADQEVIYKKRALDESLASKAEAFNANRNRLDAETTTRLVNANRAEAEAARVRLEREKADTAAAAALAVLAASQREDLDRAATLEHVRATQKHEAIEAMSTACDEYASAIIEYKRAELASKNRLQKLFAELDFTETPDQILARPASAKLTGQRQAMFAAQSKYRRAISHVTDFDAFAGAKFNPVEEDIEWKKAILRGLTDAEKTRAQKEIDLWE